MTAEAQYARQYENAQSGAVPADISVLSSYNRVYAAIRGEYRAGRGRVIAAYDHSGFAFDDVVGFSGARLDQSDRDRTIDRLTGQVQYAISPSLSAYAEGSGLLTNYSRPLLNGDPNRDSVSARILGGANFDLAGFLRGKIGVGYTFRNYDSPLYRNVSGFSAEAKIEYFPSELTTFTLSAGRTIEDANLGLANAFIDTRVQLRVDHELLRNLILTATAEYAGQDFFGSSLQADNWRVQFQPQYLVNHFWRLGGLVSYYRRTDTGTSLGSNFDEWSVRLSITLTR